MDGLAALDASSTDMGAMSVSLPLPLPVIGIHRYIDAAREEMITQFFAITGIDRARLSDSNAAMITRGVTHAIDDNMFFGLGQFVARSESHNDNYF
jgi:hypothetical protein